MDKDQLSRKLAVILHADVVDSTALVRQDEALAHQRIQDTFQRFSQIVTSHGGVAHEIRGDALVAEFPKASDAVAASIDFQETNTAAAQDLPDQIRPELRIGIAMGEVVVADNTVTGEGVVLAQRLEQLADAGGICLQGAAYETVPKRLPYNYEKLGELQLKGFDEPIRAYRVKSTNTAESGKSADRVSESAITEGISISEGFDKPSVVVLPFENLGQESDNDYFADGLTREINANLCRYRELLVIDSHSAFEYREGHANPQSFARRLEVQYITSGSIRRAGNRIRISAQLVEATTGKMLWSDKLERAYDDVFILEDEVATRIALSLASHIEDENVAKAARKQPDSMSAFDCVLRARQYLDSYDQDEIAAARALLEQAIEIDPKYAAAYACLACTYVVEYESDWCSARQKALLQAAQLSQKAVALDEFDSYAHMVMGWAYMYLEKFDLAEVHLDRAIDCNPNDYDAYCIKSWLLAFTGRGSEVTVCGTRALQLNPLAPDQCLLGIATARYTERNYVSAFELLERIGEPNDQSEALRAACLVQMGREPEAHQAAASAIELGSDFLQNKEWLDQWPFKHPGDREHFLDGLHKAGVL